MSDEKWVVVQSSATGNWYVRTDREIWKCFTGERAHLIGAAPELLKELRELVQLIAAEYPQQQQVWLASARAAIASAEGHGS